MGRTASLAERLVLLVCSDGITAMLHMPVPLSESLQMTLFQTPSKAAQVITFARRGGEFDQWVVYEEISCQERL